ncbi:MAG: MATE family efflux transporter [Spirochaetes bacterium]|nr:MATE family efflux transporter [Spirochaetota bacterium]
METDISKKATGAYLLKFSLPTIISMLLMSLFGIVDGLFVARIIDPIALAAVGIVFPFISFAMAIGLMLGTGGNAIVAKKIGEGLTREARENFSLIALTGLAISIFLAVAGLIFPATITSILGVDASVYDMVFEYLQPLLYFMPTIILGVVFQQFLITEGKAHIGTIATIIGGLLNIGLNYLLIYVLQMGLRGAALATSIGYTVSLLVGVYHFAYNRKGYLHFVKPKFDFGLLAKASVNGLSEMVTMLATSIAAIVMNNVLMRIQGPEAVAAAGIMFAGVGILTAIFMGYSAGIAPIISYNYGKNDTDNLRRVYSGSLRLLGFISVLSIALGWLLTGPIIRIYDVPVGTPIYEMAFTGFRIFIAGFVFMAYNIFASMMFTALNNGKLSGMLSFFRALVFVVVSILVLSEIFGVNGAWIALPFSEVLAFAMTVYFLKAKRSVYKYA